MVTAHIFYSSSNNEHRLRYEIKGTLDSAIVAAIQTRLLKSYSLGRTWPDAYNAAGIARKAKLMGMIFKNEYGITSEIINTIT
jgi:hypothetical protein